MTPTPHSNIPAIREHLSEPSTKFDLFVFHEDEDFDCYALRAGLNDDTPCNFSASAVQMLRVMQVDY